MPPSDPLAVAARASRSKLDEKKNVWIALLNLEKAHGSDASLAAAFKRACADQNAKHMYLQMAIVHERAHDAEAVGKTFDAACKHYKASKKVWLAKMEWQMRNGQHEGAKATLERSLQSLARRKHVATIVKFAQLEYRHGARARSLSAPRRSGACERPLVSGRCPSRAVASAAPEASRALSSPAA